MSRLNDFMRHFENSVLSEFCERNGVVTRYSRGDLLVSEGEVCRHFGFIRKGYFKFCSVSPAGEECVTGFAFKNELVCDYVRSFLYLKPSYSSIVCGAESEVLQVPLTDIRGYVLENFPDFLPHSTSVLLEEASRRYLDRHIMSAAERYSMLLECRPALGNELPFHELASYLGISRRQLHRIREGMR